MYSTIFESQMIFTKIINHASGVAHELRSRKKTHFTGHWHSYFSNKDDLKDTILRPVNCDIDIYVWGDHDEAEFVKGYGI